MKVNRWFAYVLLSLVVALSAFGCNTVRGVGQDIKQGGQAIEDAAR